MIGRWRTIFQNGLVVLLLDLQQSDASVNTVSSHKHCIVAHLVRDEVVHAENDGLADDVSYPYVVKHFGVVKRHFTSHCAVYSGELYWSERGGECGVHCMTPREMTRFWTWLFILTSGYVTVRSCWRVFFVRIRLSFRVLMLFTHCKSWYRAEEENREGGEVDV